MKKESYEVEKEKVSIKKELDSIKSNKIEIEMGDNALLKDYSLTTLNRELNITFKVDYEVCIDEVSEKMVKVSALDYSSDDKYAKDPNNRNAIIKFLQNKWVSKSDLELIIDEKKKRSIKLNQLGI